MRCVLAVLALCWSISAMVLCQNGRAQSPADAPPATEATPATEAPDAAASSQRDEWFRKLLSGSRLVGHFTMGSGDEPRLRSERYDLISVEKLPGGDLWMFTTRIRYGQHDVTVPIPLPVKWAEKTPVITLDNLTIPGLGTFDARVVITEDKYAGTWRHGDISGHLFGRIERADAEEANGDEADAQPSGDAAASDATAAE